MASQRTATVLVPTTATLSIRLDSGGEVDATPENLLRFGLVPAADAMEMIDHVVRDALRAAGVLTADQDLHACALAPLLELVRILLVTPEHATPPAVTDLIMKVVDIEATLARTRTDVTPQ